MAPRPLRRSVLALAAVLLALSLAGPVAAAEGGPQPLPAGTAAPEFTAPDIEGQPFALGDALAKGPVMVVFWSIFCGSCREELPILQQLLPKIEERGVRLVAVNLDEPSRNKTVKGFAAQQGFTFTIVYTNTESARLDIDERYQVKITPALFLLDRTGKVAFSHYGALAPEEIEEILDRLGG